MRTLKSKLKTLFKSLGKRSHEVRVLREKLELTRKSLEKRREEIASLRAQLEESRRSDQIFALRGKLEKTRKSLTKKSEEIALLRTKLDESRSASSNRREEVLRLRQIVNAYREQRNEYKEDVRGSLAIVKQLIRAGNRLYARSLSQLMYEHGNKVAGSVCWAYQSYNDGFSELAFNLLSELDKEVAIEYLPSIYFCLLVEFDFDSYGWLISKHFEKIDNEGMLDISEKLYSIGEQEKAMGMLEKLNYDSLSEKRKGQYEWFINNLRLKLAPPLSKPENPEYSQVAILDYKNVEYKKTSANLGDYTQTLALLSNLARYKNVNYSGDLGDFVNDLKIRVDPDMQIDFKGNVELTTVCRDFTSSTKYTDNKWLFAFGWYMHPSFGRFDFPFNENLRPIFISFHVNRPEMLDNEAIEYLRKYAPIGCRDWTTVYLLNSLKIDSFFSGCVTTTINNIYAERRPPTSEKIALVDALPEEGEDHSIIDQVGEVVRKTDIFTNLNRAYNKFLDLQDYRGIRTSRLHTYLPSTSIGLDVEFVPKNLADIRFDGLAPISKAEFEKIESGIKAKVAYVMSLILEQRNEQEVYGEWRRLCDPDVAQAKDRCDQLEPTPKSALDLEAIIKHARKNLIQFNQFTLEKSEKLVTLAFAFDDNLMNIFPVVIESIEQHVSSKLRIYVLSRKIEIKFFKDVSDIYRGIEFVIIDLTSIDYGDELRLLSHISESTMDRLLLPDVVQKETKILYLDIDLLILGDVSELFEINLDQKCLAGRKSKFLGWKNLWKMIFRASLSLDFEMARYLRRYAFSMQNLLSEGFNAGVLLMNLEKMRDDNFTKRFLPLIEKYKLNDQDALNLYAGADIIELSNEWNFVPSQDYCKDPKIIHWAGPAKPWLDNYVPFKDTFQAYRSNYDKRCEEKW